MGKHVPEGAVVYAVEVNRRIKIGTTTDLGRRLKAIAAMSPYPLELIGTRPGDHRLERAWHREFAEWCIHGEWFDLPAAQREILSERLAGMPRTIRLQKTTNTQPPNRRSIKQQRGPVWRTVNGRARKLRFYDPNTGRHQ
jgi:hypothetical protein